MHMENYNNAHGKLQCTGKLQQCTWKITTMDTENYNNAHVKLQQCTWKINSNYSQYCLRLLTLNDKQI